MLLIARRRLDSQEAAGRVSISSGLTFRVSEDSVYRKPRRREPWYFSKPTWLNTCQYSVTSAFSVPEQHQVVNSLNPEG